GPLPGATPYLPRSPAYPRPAHPGRHCRSACWARWRSPWKSSQPCLRWQPDVPPLSFPVSISHPSSKKLPQALCPSALCRRAAAYCRKHRTASFLVRCAMVCASRFPGGSLGLNRPPDFGGSGRILATATPLRKSFTCATSVAKTVVERGTSVDSMPHPFPGCLPNRRDLSPLSGQPTSLEMCIGGRRKPIRTQPIPEDVLPVSLVARAFP